VVPRKVDRLRYPPQSRGDPKAGERDRKGVPTKMVSLRFSVVFQEAMLVLAYAASLFVLKIGLLWQTYQATVRRDGVYTSGVAGAIDFNQELCDPMEREFSTDWQSVLDSTIQRLLAECEQKILQIATTATQELAKCFSQNGVDGGRLSNMLNTATRSSNTALKVSFQSMARLAVDTQRELSRALLPSVKERMQQSYTAAMSVERGGGVFDRMKRAVMGTTSSAVDGMFEEATKKILTGIAHTIKQLEDMISKTALLISKTMKSVFSICWEDQSDKTAPVDPKRLKQIRECRDALLPDLNKLCGVQGGACQLIGIEREEMELDVMGVESLEKSLERKLEDAKKSGNVFDLCGSDAEIDVQPAASVKVKGEQISTQPKIPPIWPKISTMASNGCDLIDLCEYEWDDDWTPPPASGFAKKKAGVKSEMI
jgi:hypothetical protein